MSEVWHNFHIHHEDVKRECPVIWNYFVNALDRLTEESDYDDFEYTNSKEESYFNCIEKEESSLDEEIDNYLCSLLCIISERYRSKYGFNIIPSYLCNLSYFNSTCLGKEERQIENRSIVWIVDKLDSWIESNMHITLFYDY